MSKRTTIVMWITVALLGCVYLFPLWQISLEAPQYPSGLGIHIWIDKITGAKPHDLQNINGLNHYIGMRAIEPDSIPELKFMKWILAGLIALGAMVALMRKKWFLVAWVVLAVTGSALGMYDFYKWEYDYGHNLDPSAAIKIPGMAYQPPMFGTKIMLNFHATAWPGLGGLAAMIAVGLASLAAMMELLAGRRQRAGTRAAGVKLRHVALLALVLSPLAITSCKTGPQPIEYGVDQCGFCTMTISDNRYGAEAVTKKGRTYKYDSIECLVNAVLENKDISDTDVRGYYVSDYASGGVLIDAANAVFLQSKKLPSPMGENLTAFGKGEDAQFMMEGRGGKLLDWDGVMEHLDRGSGEHAYDS